MAADLIRTVAATPTLENIAVLGLIVVVRTVLSFSLEIEIDGVLPWRKAELSARDDGGWQHVPKANWCLPHPAFGFAGV